MKKEGNKETKKGYRHQCQWAIGILQQHSLYDEFIYPDGSEWNAKEYPHITAHGDDRSQRLDLMP